MKALATNDSTRRQLVKLVNFTRSVVRVSRTPGFNFRRWSRPCGGGSVFGAIWLSRLRSNFLAAGPIVFGLQKEWPGPDVAKCLGVSLANVYVTRHRIAAAVKKEARRLERELEVVSPASLVNRNKPHVSDDPG